MPSAKEYQAKSLPFNEPLNGISSKTLQIHHDKLYVGYVNKMKEIAEKISEMAQSNVGLSDANQSYSILRGLREGETFATNGVYLHEDYFASLGGDGTASGSVLEAIVAKWGSFETFVNLFTATGMAVRGWVVLCFDTRLRTLKIYGCDAHNQGGVWGAIPLLVLDVYEHAYFLDYGSDRKAYILDFWKNVQWKTVNALYEQVKNLQLY